MIEITNLSKSYWTTDVIKNITCSISQWDIVSFVWWSWVGKTTLLHTVIWMEHWYSWNVTILWKKLSEYLKEKNISYVGQSYTNFPWLKAIDNILLWSPLKKSWKKTKRILQHLDIAHITNAYPDQLSWWQKQRVSLARAILQDTDIIALDEPFSALDQQTKSQLHQLLLELVHEEWKTVLLVTHDIEEAIYLSDKVIILWGKPWTIKEVMDIRFWKNRPTTLVYESNFQFYKRQAIFSIKSSSIIDSASTRKSQSIMKKHTIGLYLRSGNIPFFHAVHSWLFEKNDYQVSLQSHLTHRAVENDLLQWEISCAHMTLDRALHFCKNNKEYIIPTFLLESKWWDALVSKKEISSLQQLLWKKIWVEKNSISEFFLHYLLSKNWYSHSDVEIVELNGLEIVAALLDNTIEAWVLWEPWLTKILEYPEYAIIHSSNEFPILFDVLVCSKKFSEKNASFISTFKKVRKKSCTTLTNDVNAIREVSSYVNIPYNELSSSLKKLEYIYKTPENIDFIVNEITWDTNSFINFIL